MPEDVLTDDAVEFLTRLQRRFGPRRQELLDARHVRAQRLRGGELPDFLPETKNIREGSWQVEPVPTELQDRRVEITGPRRPEDGDQRAQLGREDVHGRLRGLELADVATTASTARST